jgi:hypothetical protein
VDDLVKSGQLYVHAPDQDPQFDSKALRGSGDWIMESVSPEYKVVTKPEAGKRGWITTEKESLQLSGAEARQKVLPLLKGLAQLYKTGGKSSIDYLEVSGLQLPGGGILNVQLENLSPRDINVLGDFFDVTLDLDAQKVQTEVQLVINSPEPECKLVEKLKKTET